MPTCDLIFADGEEYLFVRVGMERFDSTWGLWLKTAPDSYELILGPVSGYMPVEEGFERLGTSKWHFTQKGIETPGTLPLDEYTRDRYIKYSRPRGTRRQIVVPRSHWYLLIPEFLRHR